MLDDPCTVIVLRSFACSAEEGRAYTITIAPIKAKIIIVDLNEVEYIFIIWSPFTGQILI